MEAGQPRVAKCPRYGDIRIEKTTLDPMLLSEIPISSVTGPRHRCPAT